MYREITDQIQIDVAPSFVAEESKPEQNYYFFGYTVKITNLGEEAVQLLNRHWIIIDGHGRTREVHGPGVVGSQPLLKKGEHFEYTSFCPLSTPTGNMRGKYDFVSSTGRAFSAKIPLFFLRDVAHGLQTGSTPQQPTLH